MMMYCIRNGTCAAIAIGIVTVISDITHHLLGLHYVYQRSLCPYGTSNVPFGPAPESTLCGVAFESTSKPFSSPLDLRGDWPLSVFLDKVLITFKMMGVVTNY